MNENLAYIKRAVYDNCSLEVTHLETEAESQEYDACRFQLNGRKVICRNAKITPKKVGQFVTFWKRRQNGPIEPFDDKDPIDFFLVNVRSEGKLGQFIFPKSVLIQKGILSTKNKEGKRAFRVYPKWDETTSKQAERSQKWQLEYFYEVSANTDLNKVKELLGEK